MNQLFFEDEIVWNFPPEMFPFVREVMARNVRRRCPPRLKCSTDGTCIIVGYSKVLWGKLERLFCFMVFDTNRPEDWPPSEGVDPLTVAPTVRGHQTARCYKPPTAEQRAAIDAIFAEHQAKLDAKRIAATERQRRHRVKSGQARKTRHCANSGFSA